MAHQIVAHSGGSATAGVELSVERKNPNRSCTIRGACFQKTGAAAVTVNLIVSVVGIGPITTELATGITAATWIDLGLNVHLPARATAELVSVGVGVVNKIVGALIVEEMEGP